MQVELNKNFRLSSKVNFSKFSDKIGFSKNQIVDLLSNSGFDYIDESTIYLNDKHLEIICKAYVKSIKSYYKSSALNYFKLDNTKQKEIRRFFSRFVNSNFNKWNFLLNENTLDKVLGGKLDSQLIEIYFEKLVRDIQIEDLLEGLSFNDILFSSKLRDIKIEDSEDDRIFNKFKHFIKLKIPVNNLFNDIRSELESILICCHYYIFSDDEDNNGEVNSRIRFSRFMNNPREALKFNYNLKFRKRWIKTLKFS